jgi:hypothetical protein
MARGTWGGTGDIRPFACKITFQLGLSLCQTGFHLRNGSLSFDSAQEVADDVYDYANTSFRTILGVQDRMVGVDVVNMATLEGGSRSFSNVTGTQTITGAALPSYVQVPVSLKGELRARYGQGRMLWPVRPESYTTDDQLNTIGQAGLQGAIDAFVTRYVGTGLTFDLRAVNVHGVIPPKPATPSRPARPEVPASWYDVTSARLSTNLSFLRSRKQGVGS